MAKAHFANHPGSKRKTTEPTSTLFYVNRQKIAQIVLIDLKKQK